MAIQISPSIIIGVGSSGLEIINSVRELLYEELQFAGLPLVRFIHISTQSGGEPVTSLPNTQFVNEWEKIRILDASMGKDKYNQIKLKIDPDNHMYDEGLAQWLNPPIADIPDATFDAGAGNFRQAGRLCLWSNWDQVIGGINSVIGQIQHPNSLIETQNILSDYVQKKGITNLSGNTLVDTGTTRIFVTGSLVGGTASGMIIDLGYFLREYYKNYKCFGLFTVMDSATAARPASDRRAANNYAAVIELDYFSQLGTRFNYKFPNTTAPLNSENIPYEYISLLSTRNKNGTIEAIVNEAGLPDLESLHKMIGISLFFDVLGGASSAKEAIKVDFISKTGMFPTVKTEPHYLKFFSSFGATALWFPKSRISGAAAAIIIKNVSDRWIGAGHLNKGKMQVICDKAKQNLLEELRIKMSQFYDDDGQKITIAQHWNRELEIIRKELSNPDQSVQSVLHLLESFPEGNPLSSRFRQNGFYFKKLQNNIVDTKKEALLILQKIIESQINEVISNLDDGQNSISLNDITYLVELLDKVVEDFANESIPLNDFDLDFSEIRPHLDALEVEQSRILTWLVGCRNKIIKQHKNRIDNQLKTIFENETGFLVDHFLIKVFKEIQPNLKSYLMDIVNNLIKNLDMIKNQANETIKNLSKVTNQASLKMVSQRSSIEDDIEYYSSKITSNRTKQLLGALNLHSQFLKDGVEPISIFGQMMGSLQKEILRDPELSNFDIITWVQQKEPATLIKFAENALPMFEPSQDYKAIDLPTKPTLLAGGKTKQRQNLYTQLKNKNIHFDRQMDIDLDHLLYFYREESVIAISEFKAFRVWEEQYRKVAENDQFGCHIDKDPRKFDIRIHHIVREIKEKNWLKISCDLFLNEMFSGSYDNGEVQIFIYKDEFGREKKLPFSLKNPDEFIERLAKNKPALEQFQQKFENIFILLGKRNIYLKVQEYLDGLEEQGVRIDTEHYKREEEFYSKLLEEKFKTE